MKLKSRTHDYKPFNSWMELLLRAIGLWPNIPYVMYRRIFWVILLGSAQIFQYLYLLKHFKTDSLPDLMDSLSVTIIYSLQYFKLINLWFNSRTFYEIHKTITDEWNANITSGSDWVIDFLMNLISLIDRCGKLLISTAPLSVVFYASNILIKINDPQATAAKETRLLLQMEFPFDSNVSPNYEIINAVQFTHQMTIATIGGMLNALVLTIVLHLGGQLDIMRRKLTEFDSNIAKNIPLSIVINSLIEEHQRIIVLSNKIEKLFTYIALMEFFITTLLICCVGFVIVVSLGSVQAPIMLLKFFGFYVVVTVEAFIYCFSGEYLGEKSIAIGDAVYESLWYELKPKEINVLMLLIMRSQKRLTMTVGKIMDLSYERFTTILKASASYVSVLHAVY